LSTSSNEPAWPALEHAQWRDTLATLHLWTQVVGKVRLALAPWLNHGWHVPLYVHARGLRTSAMPHGARLVEISFDFVDHRLAVVASDGQTRGFALEPMSVATFYRRVMDELAAICAPVEIHTLPNEVPEPLRFPDDEVHASYDPAAARRFWRALTQAERVFERFRTGFVGKSSPPHFFWGSFDLAVTRFSGRRAPLHPGGVAGLPDAVTREAYSHEVSSAGFWPGNDAYPHAAFYSYAYPAPAGFDRAAVQPSAAFWSAELGEWLLPYDAVRTAADPERTLLDFLQTTYRAAADLARWDPALECALGEPRRPRAVEAPPPMAHR
jgi:hypothetical protein